MYRAHKVPLALFLFVLAATARATWISPFLSEIHYDNAGGDTGEFVAVTATAGTDLGGWQLQFYNGADGRQYGSADLTGVVGGDAWGEVAASYPGIQNGPDAVALVSPADVVVDFIAYEGAVTAVDGAAAGLAATRLPIAEGSATAVGWSLQRTGTADDWQWIAAAATPGVLNAGLALATTVDVPAARAVPIAGVLPLLLAGIAGWWWLTAGGGARETGNPA